jgi:hypothetical protein
MERHASTILKVAMVTLSLVVLGGCESGAQTGSVIGALMGAGVGQLAGGSTEATLIGAAVGGGAGYMLGNEADKAEAQAERDYISDQMAHVTVNMTNSNGSISQVRLRKHGIGYVGTRGEFYDHMPTQDELRPIYGF